MNAFIFFRKLQTKKLLFLVVIILSFVSFINAQDYLPEKPQLATSVYDEAKLLSVSQKSTLEEKLIHYADTTSTQIVVATINSLEGKNINFYAAQWAHKWGIGQKGKDNGVLFLIAKDDRKMAIQVGYGMEHLLTDAMSRRIIELVIAPHFKKGNYFRGIDSGTTSMMEVMSGEYVNDDVTETTNSFPVFLFIIILIIFIIVVIILIKSNKNSGNGGGYSTGTGPIILTGSGRTGGFGSGGFGSGGGGFGGGGFSGGFGGGGFGGGGASGGW